MRSVLVKYRTDVLKYGQKWAQRVELRAKTEVRYFTTIDQTSEVDKNFIVWLHWNIIDKYKNRERQIKTCNSIVISNRISSLPSPCMVTFPLLIVCNTLTLHIMSNILIMIHHKQGFFRFPPLNEQYGKYPTAYKPIKFQDFRTRTACCHSHIIISFI